MTSHEQMMKTIILEPQEAENEQITQWMRDFVTFVRSENTHVYCSHSFIARTNTVRRRFMLTSKHYRVLSAAFTGLFLLLFTVLFLTCPAGAAQKKGPRPVGVVNSSNGSVFPTGNYAVILKYDSYTGDQLYNGSDETDFMRPQQGKKPL